MSRIKYYAPSVDYAAKILSYLSRYKSKKSTLTEISKDLDINKSACLRILKTLELNNLVHYNEETKKYSLGIYISVLGHRVEENLDYLKRIKEYLDEASTQTKLTATLLQRVSVDRIMFITQSQTMIQPNLTISVGNRFPLTEVSFGKWILANASNEERDYHLKDGLKRVTDINIVDVDKYLVQLEEIKKADILISREEYTKDVIAISTPLYDWKGKIFAVIALIGISKLITDTDLIKICDTLKDIKLRCNEELKSLRVEATKFEIK